VHCAVCRHIAADGVRGKRHSAVGALLRHDKVRICFETARGQPRACRRLWCLQSCTLLWPCICSLHNHAEHTLQRACMHVFMHASRVCFQIIRRVCHLVSAMLCGQKFLLPSEWSDALLFTMTMFYVSLRFGCALDCNDPGFNGVDGIRELNCATLCIMHTILGIFSCPLSCHLPRDSPMRSAAQIPLPPTLLV
jgi:hypothetical protein